MHGAACGAHERSQKPRLSSTPDSDNGGAVEEKPSSSISAKGGGADGARVQGKGLLSRYEMVLTAA